MLLVRIDIGLRKQRARLLPAIKIGRDCTIQMVRIAKQRRYSR
jgi:hypothetical protein